MKRNPYTPVHTTPRISDPPGYARALYKSRTKDLEYIRVDMTIYSYIMEGWC